MIRYHSHLHRRLCERRTRIRERDTAGARGRDRHPGLLRQRRRPDTADDHGSGAVDPSLDEQRPRVPAHHRHVARRLGQLAGRSGATYLKPGAYNLTLKAWAAWTIRIVADVERPRPLGGGLIGFRGNGSRELPPFTTQRNTNLIWTNTGGLFSVDSGLWTLRISSQAKRGKRQMGRGVHNVRRQRERDVDDRVETLS